MSTVNETERLWYSRIGDQVREARMMAGLTQEELAEIAGFSSKVIIRIENVHCNISLHTLCVVCLALGLDIVLVPKENK